jgi:hypothetical protein
MFRPSCPVCQQVVPNLRDVGIGFNPWRWILGAYAMPIRFSDLTEDDELGYTYQGKPYSGVIEEYKNGVPYLYHEIKDGLLHGYEREWYPNGQIAVECHYCLNQRHGYLRLWYPNGQIKCEALSEYGFPIYSKAWDESGTPTFDMAIKHTDKEYANFFKFRDYMRAEGYPPPPGVPPDLLPCWLLVPEIVTVHGQKLNNRNSLSALRFEVFHLAGGHV